MGLPLTHIHTYICSRVLSADDNDYGDDDGDEMMTVTTTMVMVTMVVTITLAIKTRLNIGKTDRTKEKRRNEHNGGDGKRDL